MDVSQRAEIGNSTSFWKKQNTFSVEEFRNEITTEMISNCKD